MFTQNDYYEQKFQRLELAAQRIYDIEFEACTFTNCKFPECQFINCRFVDCTFEGCDLGLGGFAGSTLNNVIFKNTKLTGVNWAELNWSTGFSAMSFENCSLNYAIFVTMDLRKLKLTGCVAKEANFEEANLTEADLSGTDLEGARFSRTNLTNANLEGATNYTIDVTHNIVKGARFSLPDAIALLHSLGIVLNNPNDPVV